MADAKNQSLDQYLDQVAGTQGAAVDSAKVAAVNFCPHWPQIRAFLEWIKTQTKNPLARLVIQGIINFGNAKCK
jgi:hypothetical protein